MKLDSIFFTPKAEVSFTSEEYELMLACSAVHYDGVCKDAGQDRALGFAPGCDRPAGFLFSAHRIHINTGHQSVTFTFRELDTLAKILEVGRYLDPVDIYSCDPERATMSDPPAPPKPASKGAQALELHIWIRRVLQAMNESQRKPIDNPLNVGVELQASIVTDLVARKPKPDEGGARYADRPY